MNFETQKFTKGEASFKSTNLDEDHDHHVSEQTEREDAHGDKLEGELNPLA